MMDAGVQSMVGRQYHTVDSEVCWTFCRAVLGRLGFAVPSGIQDMTRVGGPKIGAVVLFRSEDGFHAGVVWPDGLHFIHPEFSTPGHPPTIRQRRLTELPFKDLVDGYYMCGGAR